MMRENWKVWRKLYISRARNKEIKVTLPVRITELQRMGFKKKDFNKIEISTDTMNPNPDGKVLSFEFRKKGFLKRILGD